MDQEKTNFELNLLPVISLLAVLLGFLLLTAVWINIGSLDVKQGLGSETFDAKENPASLWAKFEDDGSIVLMVKDLPEETQARQQKFTGENMWSSLEEALGYFRQKYPEMKTALILPQPNSNYSNVIKTMDTFKRSGWENLGIAPL